MPSEVPAAQPIFAQHYRHGDLHCHAPISQLVYHLGPNIMTPLSPGNLALTDVAAQTWDTFTRPGPIRKEIEKLPKLKIPGGRMQRK